MDVVAEQASEFFLASTTRDVQAVVRWDDRDLEVGPVTKSVQEEWRTREAADIDP
jgi:branched-chain amino acid aminotransferase